MVKITEGPGAPAPSSRSEGPEGVAKPFTMKTGAPKASDLSAPIKWPKPIQDIIDKLVALQKKMEINPGDVSEEDFKQGMALMGQLISAFYDPDFAKDPNYANLKTQLSQAIEALGKMADDFKIANPLVRHNAIVADIALALARLGQG